MSNGKAAAKGRQNGQSHQFQRKSFRANLLSEKRLSVGLQNTAGRTGFVLTRFIADLNEQNLKESCAFKSGMNWFGIKVLRTTRQ
jgi:hypothetical protein